MSTHLWTFVVCFIKTNQLLVGTIFCLLSYYLRSRCIVPDSDWPGVKAPSRAPGTWRILLNTWVCSPYGIDSHLLLLGMLLEVFRLDKLAHWQSLIFWRNHIVPSFVLVEDTGDTPTDPLTISHWLLSTRSSLPKTWSKYYKGGHCCRILYNLIYLFPKKQSRNTKRSMEHRRTHCRCTHLGNCWWWHCGKPALLIRSPNQGEPLSFFPVFQ